VNKHVLLIIGLIIAIGIFYSTGSRNEKADIAALTKTVEQQVAGLHTALDAGTLRNDAILTTYAEQLKKTKPELAPLVTNLEKDATSASPALKALDERLAKVKSPDSVGTGTREDVFQELMLLKTASTPSVFNDSLTDSINVIADLSGGTLARINAPPKNAEPGAVAQPGSQLVGNPAYGHWQQNNGMSIWEWYGAYAMFRDLTGGRNYNYNNWSQNRPWSYYNDYGRDTYASRNERTSFADNDARQRKTYGAQDGRRSSFYAKKTNPAFSAPPVSSSSFSSSSPANQNNKYQSSPRRSSSYSSPRRSSGGRRR
jgi:hypothetical protein